MTNTGRITLLLMPFVVGSVCGCSTKEVVRNEEPLGLVTQALSQSNIVACTGSCAQAFDGTPSAKFPVYYASKWVTPPNGGEPERIVTAAFLMKCGANTESAARAFGYEPSITSLSGIDRLDSIDDLGSLQELLGGMTPVTLDCMMPNLFQVFRRIDASHSAANPAYYVQLRQKLVEEAVAKGGIRPAAIYGLDCANPLAVLWENWASGQQPEEILNNQAVPINEAVVREWTEISGMAPPTIICGTTANYRTELPIDPPKNTRIVTSPSNRGAELYYAQSNFNGVSNTTGAYYLISNGLGYAIDGCRANIGALVQALGLPADTKIPELPLSDPKFTASNPNGQPVLRCEDAGTRVFESINAPKPYQYFSFAGDMSSMVRFVCRTTENFFLGALSNPQTTQIPEESLIYLSGSGREGRIFEIGCANGACALGQSMLGGCTLN